MNGLLYLSQIKPKKEKFDWVIKNPEYADIYVEIDSNKFPSVKWEDDEPTEAYITLTEPQEQPKHEIDWEQRRYELAKDLLLKKYLEVSQFSLKREDDIRLVIGYADKIINELKKQSDEL